MSHLMGICDQSGVDDVIRKIRRLSVVLDTSVKEMERDYFGEDPIEAQMNAVMDYRNILVQLQQQKALQDDRRLRLR